MLSDCTPPKHWFRLILAILLKLRAIHHIASSNSTYAIELIKSSIALTHCHRQPPAPYRSRRGSISAAKLPAVFFPNRNVKSFRFPFAKPLAYTTESETHNMLHSIWDPDSAHKPGILQAKQSAASLSFGRRWVNWIEFKMRFFFFQFALFAPAAGSHRAH